MADQMPVRTRHLTEAKKAPILHHHDAIARDAPNDFAATSEPNLRPDFPLMRRRLDGIERFQFRDGVHGYE